MRRHAKATVAVLAMLLTFAVASAAQAAPPAVTIDNASDVGFTSAKVKGTFDRQGQSTTYRFQFVTQGTFEAEGWSNPSTGPEATLEAGGPGPQPVPGPGAGDFAELTGLAPGTTYHLRLVAENADGSATSPEPYPSFETATVTKPTVAIGTPSAITGDSAHLVGSVNPNGSDPAFSSSCVFEYITDEDFQARDETQRLVIKASGGDYTLELNGQITAPIAYNASAATVKGALEALSNVTPGSIAVSGGPGDLTGPSSYILTFAGSDPDLYVDPTDLTGPGKAQVSTVRNGFFENGEVQTLTISAVGGTFTLSFAGSAGPQTTAPIPFNASASALQSALEALSGIGAGNIAVSDGPGGEAPYTLTFQGALGDINVKQIVANSAALTGNGGAAAETLVQGRSEGFEGAMQVPCQPETVVGTDPVPVQADLADLQPNTTYHVRLSATNPGGASVADTTFKTVAIGPTVAPTVVGALTSTSARLGGLVDANNTPTTYYFQYSTDPGFASPVSLPANQEADAGAGNDPELVFQDVTGLQPNTTYYWRLSADSAEGTDSAAVTRGFTTWPEPGPDQGGVGAEGRRQYELVSTSRNNSGNISSAVLSEDGNRALVMNLGGGIGDSAYAFTGLLLSTRTPSGWTTSDPLPPRGLIDTHNVQLWATSPELDVLQLQGVPTFVGNGPNVFARYDRTSGDLRVGASLPQMATNSTYSADMSHALVWSAGRLLEVLGDSEPQVVGLMPDDDPPACDLTPSDVGERTIGSIHQNWISDDGSRIFFLSRGDDCANPRQLYVREGGAGASGSTTLISGPPVAGPGGETFFAGASADGSEVYFTSSSRLDALDLNEGPDIYRYTFGESNECLTCVVPDARVDAPRSADLPSTVVVSADGSRVYFSSEKVLAPGGRATATNIYVWRREDPTNLGYVGPSYGSSDYALEASGQAMTAQANADGSVLLFASRHPDLDRLTDTEGGRYMQFYRYDDRSRSLTCITCAPRGQGVGSDPGRAVLRPRGLVMSVDDSYTMSEDGRTIAFASSTALVPADTNGAQDVYEWDRGRVYLVTDGVSEHDSGLLELGDDGRDLLFYTPNELLPGRPDRGTLVFDARIGGGFPQAVAPTPCAGDGCRDALAPPPADASPATPIFSGPGNETAKPPRCRKGKTRKQGRCVKRFARRSKGQKARAHSNRGGAK